MSLVKNISIDADVDQSLYELMELRSEISIGYLLEGLDLDEESAFQLLENLDDDTLTQQERDIRDRLVAGIDNIIEFSVCAEYQAFMELPDEIDMDDQDMLEELEDLSDKYHLKYASVENEDIEYAGGIALKWVTLYSASTWLTYMTMGDDRVRPWHRELEGYSAPRDMFPQWMIPPIEWGCRCRLEDMSGNAVENSIPKVYDKYPRKPKQLDDIFSESLAKCGRIFGKSHPYFSVRAEHKEKLSEYVLRLKEKYHA
jgi:hypothetical protein